MSAERTCSPSSPQQGAAFSVFSLNSHLSPQSAAVPIPFQLFAWHGDPVLLLPLLPWCTRCVPGGWTQAEACGREGARRELLGALLGARPSCACSGQLGCRACPCPAGSAEPR